MILFRLIAWPYIRKHLLRTLLTTLGIVLGVSLFVAMHTANESVLFAFHQTIDRIAGATQLQITAGDAGFSEEVLERVQSLSEIRAAAPVIEAVTSLDSGSRGNLLVLGVDMTGDQSLRDYRIEGGNDNELEDPLVFLAQPDSVILTKDFARANGIHIGSQVPMDTMAGKRVFTVRGLMQPGGLANAYGGNLMVMDIYAAQKVFGRGTRFDRIDAAINKDSSIAETKQKLASLLGPGFQIQEPSARGNEFDSLSQVFSATTNISSAFALFIGTFIINNSLQIAVTHRRSEIGILRALGATRRQIIGLFLGEGAAAGLIGSVIGVGIGAMGARVITAYFSTLLAESYGVAQKAQEVSGSLTLNLSAILLGVATSVIAALIPARTAARVDPVVAMQKGSWLRIATGETSLRTAAALSLLLVSGLCLVLPWRAGVYLSDLLTVIAALLIVPAASALLTRGWRAALKLAGSVEGVLAADSVLSSPRRASGAVSALMLSLGLVIALGGIAQGAYREIRNWLNAEFSADFFVSPAQSLTAREFRFPDSMRAPLQAIPGIASVDGVREVRVAIRGVPIMIVAADPGLLHQISSLSRVEGNSEKMYQAVVNGKGVLASETFTLLRGFQMGDIVDLPAPNGVLRLPIVGVVKEYTDQQGTLMISRDEYVAHWGDNTVNLFAVHLTPGSSENQVRHAITGRFQGERRLFVLGNREVRGFILGLADQWFGTTYIQIGIAVLVAALGIVNALTVSITDRRRELGVLQAVGGLRGQIRRTVWVEGILIGLTGLALGLLLGGIQLYFSLQTTAHDISGLRLSYLYPWQLGFVLCGVVLVTAFAAAVGPAESVIRAPLLSALEYE